MFFTRTTLFTTVIIVVRSLKTCYIVYYNAYYYYCGAFIEKHVFILIGCCVSEIHAHLCPYIVMYGLRLFIVKNYIVYQNVNNGYHGVLSVCNVSFLNSVLFLRYGG